MNTEKEYSDLLRDLILEELAEELELEAKKKKPCKPSKGKRFAKRVNGKCRSFGQKGQAKGGGDRIRPGTKKGDAYCARSLKIKKCKNPPCANALSRKKWKCRGAKSMKEQNQQRSPVVHFQDWLVNKTKEVHGKPGQGSVFAISAEKVKALVEKIISQSNIAEIEKAATGTGVIERSIPGVGYDLVARVSNGKAYDRQGKEVPGQMMTTKKSERGGMIDVPAIKTTLPAKHFSTDKLTIIVRQMKNQEGQVLPGEYIILSAFPGDTGADTSASEWSGKYAVVIPS